MDHKHIELMKKLDCLDAANQWIFYDDRFQNFFNFLTTNIREVNILTEHEALEYEEICNSLDDHESEDKRKLEKLSGLLDCNSNEVTLLSNEIEIYKEAIQEYVATSSLARSLKTDANVKLSELENKIAMLTIKEKDLFAQCQTEAKSLETLQDENRRLYKESRNCITKLASPPLFFCQLALEKYYPKCDSLMQYLNLYIQENYKVQDCLKYENESSDSIELTTKLSDLRKHIEEYTLKSLEEEAKIQATQSMIDRLELSHMSTVNVDDLERECNNLETLVEHHLKVTYETLRNDLCDHVRQHTQQRIELALYENTQDKLERALKRRSTQKELTKIISDALLNGDLVWIGIQLDLERLHNQFDNSKQLAIESQACWRRIKVMQDLNGNAISSDNLSSGFLEVFADLLMRSGHAQRVRCETKACLYEYEKFCRLFAYALQNMLNGRSYQAVKGHLKEFKNLSSMLKSLVYDSPIEAPILYNVNLLRPIYNAKMNRNHFENNLRNLRTKFQTNIVERMEKEPHWRASQLLWIWFLKQPKRLLRAIEEIKQAAANASTLPGVKSVSGIKRK